ncbi:arginine deiminase family protein [Bacillus sp. 31A1R]|uniref:Arginine deiminase family protein n=1 Tax=Robertmurraya mangrovi TaxID=3098077 RepID=A0ABU5IWN8_9BACI|nr:arginine deiminase family protein [Bacillus sp. 31A1R]MDZ5471552.1 arginine deiminase family protein [Bacillus sp. 31A1R]
MLIKDNSIRLSCLNEYDPLKTVLVCKPDHMTVKDTIPETDNDYKKGLSLDRAMKQHRHFVSALEDYGVEVLFLPSQKQFPEQVFTRDIGYTLGEEMYIAEIASFLRQGEEDQLREWLKKANLPYNDLNTDRIEGGDVLIDGSTVYVGISNRTTEEAANHLQSKLKNFEVITIPFTDEYLHLDCVFNILSPTEALIYPEEIHDEKIKYLKSRYDLIEISKEEQYTLGTNVLSIGHKRVFSLPVNKNVNMQLRARGYEVIEIDLSEIIKSGGAFRCCTLPLLRES